MNQVTWGIIGPGAIAHNFAQGLAECESGRLAAIASRDAGRRAAFGDRFGVPEAWRYDSYDALIASEVEAIYIATPHPFHAELALKSMRAGKHVLVEKPAGLIAGEVVALTETAAQQGVFFAEGLMYRSHPQIARALEIIATGTIGQVRHIKASFGFAAGFDPASRLFDPGLAGGAILDVGVYPVSLARLFAGVGQGRALDPVKVSGTATLAASGVDATAYATLLFPVDITASLSTAVTMNMANTATIIGSKGQLHLPDPWVPGRNAGPSDAVIEVTVEGESWRETLEDPRILFAHEAEAASRAIRAGQTQLSYPAPTWADSIGTMRVVDAWRAAAGYVLPGETPEGIRRLAGAMPAGLPAIPTTRIAGSDRDISMLVIGCDNRDTLAEGAIVWDAWWEAGGNAFDTGHIYGGGKHEALLGKWMKARGVANAANVIVKGAHSPYCVPDAIEVELDISLARLGLDHAPFYIMHRDNSEVPVGEFVDQLDALRTAGKIGAYGGSNWSAARLAEANAYAKANGKHPMTILNNNLSLAVMEIPLWGGCLSANNAETLAFLRETGTAHLSWSSQARGYFLRVGERFELPEDTNPDKCFASAENEERLRRATELARKKGVHPHNIATAWVLGQSFPSLALIGPRSPGEIASTLPALTLELSEGELAWLNLEADMAP